MVALLSKQIILLLCTLLLLSLQVDALRGVQSSAGAVAARALKEDKNNKNKDDVETLAPTFAPKAKDVDEDGDEDEATVAPALEKDQGDDKDVEEDEDEEMVKDDEEDKMMTQEPTEATEEEPTAEPTDSQKETEKETPVEEEGGGEPVQEAEEAPVDEEDMPADTDVTEAPEETDVDQVVEPEVTDAPVGESQVQLTPFTIVVDYEGEITEDPGMEEYIFTELQKRMEDLVSVDLDMSVGETKEAAIANAGRRYLAEQYLYYTGTAIFDEGSAQDADYVRDLQNTILSDTEAVTNVITTGLGVSEGQNLTVSAVESEETETETDESGAEVEDDNDGLGTTGVIIVAIAASIGGIALCLIVVAALCIKQKEEPNYGKDLNTTMETVGH